MKFIDMERVHIHVRIRVITPLSFWFIPACHFGLENFRLEKTYKKTNRKIDNAATTKRSFIRLLCIVRFDEFLSFSLVLFFSGRIRINISTVSSS